MKLVQTNSLVLAYIGDSIYELYIREYLINKNINKVNLLQEESKKYVSAKSQDMILKKLKEKQIFTLEEEEIIKKGRNAKSNSKPKNTSILIYKNATSLESLFGYLYLSNQNERIKEIMTIILEDK